MGGRFLFTTLGSLGDLHPYIAVGIGLRERGHTVTIASSEIYRAKVEGEGLLFHALRPDLPHVTNASVDAEIWRRIMHPRTGPEFVFRKLIMPWLEQTFEDTVAAAREADVLAGHSIAFATPTVAEHLKKPWISVVLQPSILLSALDPPVMPGAPYSGTAPCFDTRISAPVLSLRETRHAPLGRSCQRPSAAVGIALVPQPHTGPHVLAVGYAGVGFRAFSRSRRRTGPHAASSPDFLFTTCSNLGSD